MQFYFAITRALAAMSENASPSYPRNRKQLSNSASGLPKRIILVRHGESLGIQIAIHLVRPLFPFLIDLATRDLAGNADASAYCSVPDWQIPLVRL